MKLFYGRLAFTFVVFCAASDLHSITPPAKSVRQEAWKENRSLSLPQEEYGPVHRGASGGDLLLLLCDTADRPADRELSTALYFEERFAGDERSVSAHWFEATRGQIKFRPEIVGWIRLPDPFSEYVSDLQHLARHAFAVLPGDFDWSRFDWDGDGLAEGIVIVHSGGGAEESGKPSDIWSQVRRFSPVGDDPPVELVAHVPEVGKLGVYAHEMGHLFGLPDLYDRTMRSMGLGIWSLMAHGTWAGNGERPVGLDGWSLSKLGVAVESPPPGDWWSLSFSSESRGPLMIESVADRWEYFVVSWRNKSGVDSLLPGEGLEILHVNERFRGNSSVGHYQVALEQADGLSDLERSSDFRGWGDAGDLYPGMTENRSFRASSNPSSRLQSGLRSGVALRMEAEGEGVRLSGTSNAPLGAELEVQSLRIVSGGRNEQMLPGALCRLQIGVQNRGNAHSPTREIRIRPEDDYLRAVTGSVQLDPLEPGEWTTEENALILELQVEGDFTGPGLTRIRLEPDSIWLNEPPLLEIGIAPADREGWPTQPDLGWEVGEASIADGKLIVGDRSGRLVQIDASGGSHLLVDLHGMLAGRCAVADVNGEGGKEIAAITEGGELHLIDADGRSLPGWPVDLGVEGSSGPLLFQESDRSWSVAVSVGNMLHRRDLTGLSRPGWPVQFQEECGVPSLLFERGEALIAVCDDSGEMHLLDLSANRVEGWPVNLQSTPTSSIVIADFGEPILVVASADGSIHAHQAGGSAVPGWPVKSDDVNTSSRVAPADMDGDGFDEIAVAMSRTCRLLDREGKSAPGWPVGLISGAHTPLLLADIDGDFDYEILTGSHTRGWSAWKRDGRLLSGWPLPPEGLAGGSLLGDLDGDGMWELYCSDSFRGWQSFSLAGKVRNRPAWTIVRGDAGSTGNISPPNGEIADLAISITDPASLREKAWAGDSIAIEVIITNRGNAPSRAVYLWSGWSSGGSILDTLQQNQLISRLMPGDSLVVNVPVLVPFLESAEESFIVRVDGTPGEIDPRNNSDSVFVERTIPGDPIAIPGYGVAPTEVDFHDGILYRLIADWVVPDDLEGGRELGDRAFRGNQVSAGSGYYLAMSGGELNSVNIDTGDRTVLTQSGSDACCPHAGGERPVWVENRCGGTGAITIYFADEERTGYVSCEGRIVEGPVSSGGDLYWIEGESDSCSLMGFSIRTGEIRTLYKERAELGPMACDSSGVIFAWKHDGTTDLMFHDRRADSTFEAVTSRGPIESITMDGGIAVWSEENASGSDLHAVRASGGRVMPVSLAPGNQEEPALSGSTVVWIDGRTTPAVCRGLRLHPGEFGDQTISDEGEEEATPFRFQFLRIKEEDRRVRLEWKVVGKAGEGEYALYRTSAKTPQFSDAVRIAGGTHQGEGYYFHEDHLIDLERAEVEFHYFVEVWNDEWRSREGPFSIRLSESPLHPELQLSSPNPASNSVRFSLSFPAQLIGGNGRSEIEVYNVTGRRIISRPFPVVQAGRIDLEWDLRDRRGKRVTAGIYFVRVSVRGRAISPQKVVVLGGEEE